MRKETTAPFWRGVKPGDTITLSDPVTVFERMQAGKGTTPESYQVGFRISVKNDLAEWIFLCVNEANLVFVIAKIVDGNISLMLMDQNPDWEPATRLEILGTDREFIFDLNSAQGNDADTLHYVDRINHDLEIGQVVYHRKGQGEQNGTVHYNPIRSGVSGEIATIVEYATAEGVNTDHDGDPRNDPELMLVESGQPGSGVIKLLIGRPLNTRDVLVMQQ